MGQRGLVSDFTLHFKGMEWWRITVLCGTLSPFVLAVMGQFSGMRLNVRVDLAPKMLPLPTCRDPK